MGLKNQEIPFKKGQDGVCFLEDKENLTEPKGRTYVQASQEPVQRHGKLHTTELHDHSNLSFSREVCTILLAHLINGPLFLRAWTTTTTRANTELPCLR